MIDMYGNKIDIDQVLDRPRNDDYAIIFLKFRKKICFNIKHKKINRNVRVYMFYLALVSCNINKLQ